jgi:hypothetical protein
VEFLPDSGHAVPNESPISRSPIVAATGEQPHSRSVAANDQPVSVMLDFVHPTLSLGRFYGADGNAEVDEAIGARAVVGARMSPRASEKSNEGARSVQDDGPL